jgi:hypothetical protein
MALTNPLDVPEAIPGLHGWAHDRHIAAVRHPRTAHERAIVNLFAGIGEMIAASEASMDGTPITEGDYMLCEIVRDLCVTLGDYLNYELGRLDGGTCSVVLAGFIEHAGFDPDIPSEPLGVK